MNEIISRISEIEATAAAIMEDAEVKKKELATAMDKAIEEFDKKLEADTRQKIESMKLELETEFHIKAEKLSEQSKASINELGTIYNNHHSAFADKIFKRLIEN